MVQSAQARRRRQPSVRSSPDCSLTVPLLYETVRGDIAKIQKYMHRVKPSMYASMTTVTRMPHSSQRRSGSVNAITPHIDGLLGTPIKALHRFTSPHICRRRDMAKTIRFDRV